MLYTEGGDNMFAELRKRIQERSITKDQFNIWLCRWIINIAGFRGHENHVGSIYFTNKTATSLRMLIDELTKLWRNPQHDVLTAYLNWRAESLKVKSAYLAHIGALMRLHKVDEGKELQQWFDDLQQDRKEALEKEYAAARKTMKVTPTYQPAVLDNLRVLGCSIAEAIEIYSSIREQAGKAYKGGIISGTLKETTPLNFRMASLKENLSPLIEEYRARGTVEFTVDLAADGAFSVKLTQKPFVGKPK